MAPAHRRCLSEHESATDQTHTVFSRSARTAKTTSMTVNGRKTHITQGGGERRWIGIIVHGRTAATFVSKKWCMSSAQTVSLIGVRPRHINVSMDRQNCRGVESSASIFAFQKASRFRRRRSLYSRRRAFHAEVATATSAGSARRRWRTLRRTTVIIKPRVWRMALE